MATNVPTIVDGDTITDDWTLAVEAAIEELQVAVPEGWTSYTPVLTNWTIGTTGASLTGAYFQVGKLVAVQIAVVFGTGATFHASNPPVFTLPVTASAGSLMSRNMFSAMLQDANGPISKGSADLTSSTTVRILRDAVSGTNIQHAVVTSTTPHTWAATDTINLWGVYRAA